MLVSIPYAEHLGNMASIYFRGSTAEAAAAKQDLFQSRLCANFRWLEPICNGSHMSSLRSGHAMFGACHHMSTSKF